jgi:hypothetical protein
MEGEVGQRVVIVFEIICLKSLDSLELIFLLLSFPLS